MLGRGRDGGGGGGGGGVTSAWLRGEIERPSGEMDMGTYSTLAYTQEQQSRLGVDSEGNKVKNKINLETNP